MLDHLRKIPLNSLRVFEAAARLGSFAQAADELAISAAAVSQQIKKLEDCFQLPLFERIGRSVRVTPVGRRLHMRSSENLKQLDDAVREVLAQSERSYISISTVSSVAAIWLVPRLVRWRRDNPEVDIRVSTGGQLVNFQRDQIDLAIRLGDGDYAGCHSELLTMDTVVPLCHPNSLDGLPRPTNLKELPQHTLIHFTPIYGDVRTGWGSWLDSNGIDYVDSERGLFFDNQSSAISAATSGQGIVLALRSLVENEIESGQLIVPFDDIQYPEIGWHLVTPHAHLEHSGIGKFRDWLVAQFAET